MVKEHATEKEAISNHILLLYLISKAARRNLGITKLQKLAYLAEYNLAKERTKAFTYHFEKSHYGPFSKAVRQLRWLCREKDCSSHKYQTHEKGERLLHGLEELSEENQIVLSVLDEKVINAFSKKTALTDIAPSFALGIPRCSAWRT